jgi:hypothetical protein
MPEINTDIGESLPSVLTENRPDADVMAEGEAQAAAVQSLEAEHAVAENPERRCADIKIWVEAECDYFGIEPKNDPVADQLTEILFAHEQTQFERGRADYDVTDEDRRRLDRVVERGYQTLAEDDETAILTEQAEVETTETAVLAEEAQAEAAETEEEAETTLKEEVATAGYREAVAELAGLPNTEIINRLLTDDKYKDVVPSSEVQRLESFVRIIAIADRVPEDAPLIRQRLNQLDMSQGVPDPVQFIQSAIFSSPDYNSGVSQATQDAIAAEFGITPTRPAQPRNATEMQTSLREGRGTREVTEIQEVEEPPGSGIFVEKEVVVGEEPIPFDEGDPLVLSAGNPRVVAYADPPGSENYRFVGEVDGAHPVAMRRMVPADGAFPAEDINNDMNEMLVDAVCRNHGLAGGVQGLMGLSDGTLGVATDIDSNALGRSDLTQGFIGMCLGENTTLGNRFLSGEEMSAIGREMRHLAPDGDFGAFNRMDAAASAQVMQAMFGEGDNEIVRNMARARDFINTGGAETPSYQNLYAQMYPDDAANGYARLRGIIGDDGMAMLDLNAVEAV